MIISFVVVMIGYVRDIKHMY